MITWRDDDLGYLTKVEDFKKVHEMFNEYNQVHTIAILTKDLEKNMELVDYINSQKNITCQLHSHDHIDLALATEKEIVEQLGKGVATIETLFGKKPTVLYPPFNSVNEKVIRIADICGVTTSWEKISILYYIKHKGDIMEKTVNFHFFDYSESILIGAALKIYTERQKL